MKKNLVHDDEFERKSPISRMISGSDVETSKRLNVETAKRPDVQTPKRAGVQTAKSKSEEYVKMTFYVHKNLFRELHLMNIDRGSDLSTLINEAILELTKKHKEQKQ